MKLLIALFSGLVVAFAMSAQAGGNCNEHSGAGMLSNSAATASVIKDSKQDGKK